MSAAGWLQLLVTYGLVLALAKPLGAWLHRVLERDLPPLGPAVGALERGVYRVAGVDAAEQTWLQYTAALLGFNLVGCLALYALLRVQHLLPLNGAGTGQVSAHLALNTAVSFTTNTNWQSYAGESTLGHLPQLLGLTVQNFVSAATGVGVALALARGLTRREARTVGNFWRDLVRTTLYVLLPLALVLALALVATGVPQDLANLQPVTTLEGATQHLALGPVASQEAIKVLGTNGGGFFNVNSAHPFENPSPLSNLLEVVALLLLPAALTHTFGLMTGDARQGRILLLTFLGLLLAGLLVCGWAEGSFHGGAGNLEGKETRFGVAGSVLFATATTGTSCGAVNAMHESFTPLGGLVPLGNILLGEVVFGGVGAGLYAALVYALLTVFLAGLMVGRTPEYLGKKLEVREITLSTLYVLIFPLLVLVPAAVAVLHPDLLATVWQQPGPHGLTEVLYACTSAAGNNGSAFAGLTANTNLWNPTLALGMLFGRFAMIVPCLALAGSLVGKRRLPAGAGTFPTHGALFGVLLAGVMVVVGALTFFPVLSLGPLLEQLQRPDVRYVGEGGGPPTAPPEGRSR